jgi:hypothetical protein
MDIGHVDPVVWFVAAFVGIIFLAAILTARG